MPPTGWEISGKVLGSEDVMRRDSVDCQPSVSCWSKLLYENTADSSHGCSIRSGANDSDTRARFGVLYFRIALSAHKAKRATRSARLQSRVSDPGRMIGGARSPGETAATINVPGRADNWLTVTRQLLLGGHELAWCNSSSCLHLT